MRLQVRGCLFLGIFLLFCAVASAQGTYTAASCSYHDVNACINNDSQGSCTPKRHGAVDGDTVIIPTCTSMTPDPSKCTGNTWCSQLTITKAIILKGQGIGSTVLIDNNPKGCSGNRPLISISPPGTAGWRITGFTVWPYTGEAATAGCSAEILISGGSHAFRVDHIECDFDGYNGTPGTWTPDGSGTDGAGATNCIMTEGDLWGVIDHVKMYGWRKHAVMVHHRQWGTPGANSGGDVSWAQADSMGAYGHPSNRIADGAAVYMEDDVAVQTHPNSGSNPFACEWGARCVLRFSETPTVGSHGPEGSDRGIRHIEVYNNNMHMANTASWNNGSRNGKAVSVRSGTAMVFNNDITSSTNDYVVATELSYYRCNLGAAHICRAYNPWGICDGTSAWDKIPSTGPYPCLDGIGRGQGVLVNRSSPAWPNQVLDPVYSWGNRMQGNQYPGISAHPVGNPPQFTENVDYYNEVSGFNGTLGVGRGALAKRPNCSPTACTAGVAYWATDQGNWNHSGKAAWDGSTQGTLYRWTGSAWETYYVPFPYPHPLVTEAGGAESQLESH